MFPGFRAQPHRRHKLHRLLGSGRRDRLRVLRCRPSLLQPEPAGPGPDNYSSIDIQPGYQKLCGDNQSVHGALPFVRFRHTDSDIVRSARQQDFIRWAKAQYPISELFANRDRLLRIFGKHSTLDKGLQSVDGIIELFDLVLNADGSTIKQIQFPADLQPCTVTSCYVTAKPPPNGPPTPASWPRRPRQAPRPSRPPIGQGPQAPLEDPHRRA